jgi:Tol biopolymer transport system component
VLVALVGVFVLFRAAPWAQQPPLVRSRLVWFDRTGKQLGTVGDLADYGNLELSPDGKQVAVAVLDVTRKTHDLWFYDTQGNGRARITSSPADENWLIWSSDGRRIVFNSGRRGGLDLFQAPARGGAPEELLLASDVAKWPVSWSRDGRTLLFVTSSRRTGNDIWVLPLSGDRKPYALMEEEYNENWAAFSPDGRWIAYSSTESGDAEVYVTAFPPATSPGGRANRKWLISGRGGWQPRWRRDGKELFYLSSDRKLMAVAIDLRRDDVEVGESAALFDIRLPYPPYHAFDVAEGGTRFLVNTAVLGPGKPTSIAN